MIDTLELSARIVLAAGVGAALGLERERSGHEAGMRTHALVAVGSAAFSLAGAYGFTDVTSISDDPTRIAAQVATGIGFVGAGAVLRSGGSVRGLTTASSLWVSAAVGVAAAAGLYVPVVVILGVALAILVVLRLIDPVGRRFDRRLRAELSIECTVAAGDLAPMLATLKGSGCEVESVRLTDGDPVSATRTVNVVLSCAHAEEFEELLDELRGRRGVDRIEAAIAGL